MTRVLGFSLLPSPLARGAANREATLVQNAEGTSSHQQRQRHGSEAQQNTGYERADNE